VPDSATDDTGELAAAGALAAAELAGAELAGAELAELGAGELAAGLELDFEELHAVSVSATTEAPTRTTDLARCIGFLHGIGHGVKGCGRRGHGVRGISAKRVVPRPRWST
jgi:hypothetical protein